jgi:NADH dehydrogenase FAD-containing subunit
MKTIVVLGAGFAALPLIHQVMRRHALKRDDLKLIMVAPNTHMHWAIAMPRIVVPGQMDDSKVMIELGPLFKQYPPDKFERILGKASGLDANSNTLTVTLNDGGKQRDVKYDYLIVATGSSSSDNFPWKVIDDTARTTEKIHEIQRQVEGAKTIVVAGGGFTGVETAGELGYEYSSSGKKEVYFVYSEDLPFAPSYLDAARKAAESELKKLKVKLVPSTKVIGSATNAKGETTLELRNSKDGKTTTLKTQAYLPALGLTPNTQFAPAEMLDARTGRMLQTPTLQVKGHENIFAIGDVGDMEVAAAKAADTQLRHMLDKTIPALLQDGSDTASNGNAKAKTGGGVELPVYEPDGQTTFAATLGRSKATGQAGTWKLPSLLIWWLKGRYLGTDKAGDYAAGKRGIMKKYE